MTSTLDARARAVEVLERVLIGGHTLDEAWAQGDDAYTHNLVLTTLRHLGQIDAIIQPYLQTPMAPSASRVQHALRIGVTQLLLLETPPHAAVNETVEVIKRGRHAPLSGLVNAVLKKIANEKPALGSAEFNIPSWLKGRWRKAYGKEAVEQIARVAVERPPLDLNMQGDMPVGARLDEHIWRLPFDHEAVTELPGFGVGTFFVQDVAASMPVRMLGDVKNLEVLDLAAAPGGKAAQLARAGAKVTALDKSEGRMKKIVQNMTRLQLNVQMVTADILTWENKKQFDVVLLDAPCSATGTWRRHPEVLLLTSEKDIAELAAQQREMMTRALNWVKPGGRLLYCVCSMEPEEGEAQVDWFAPTYKVRELARKRTLPHEIAGGQDGFFMACFEKIG